MKHSATSHAFRPIDSYPAQLQVRELVEGIPHGIVIMDRELRVVFMNSFLEALSGYGSDQARGMDVDGIMCSNLPSIERTWRKALDSGEPASWEGDMVTSQRKRLPVRFTFKPLRDEAGSPIGHFALIEDISALKQMQSGKSNAQATDAIIGKSHGVLEVMESIPVLASTNATLLITGQTGTGKDLLAETIHKASKRAGHPFIKVNCGALPEALLESELFGHARGAFTGAHADKPGLFKLAQGGTVFLTEIGDLPLALQVKLLTVLDDREFFPVGASKKVSVDVRLIAATHHDLKKLVQEGKFREDLYFRLNVLRSHMPPLNDRAGDVPILLAHFLEHFCRNVNKPISGFTKRAMERLESYDYPGNVRELCNIVEYAVTMCMEGKITPEHLPQYINAPRIRETDMSAHVATTSSPAKPAGDSWSEIEKRLILDALTKAGGNRGKAAQSLGWGRSTLWRKIKIYGIW